VAANAERISVPAQFTVNGQTHTVVQSGTTSNPPAARKAFDFDGDGKADVSFVFRPSNGAWYLNQSTAGFTRRVIRRLD
jgi:hypothetical protein